MEIRILGPVDVVSGGRTVSAGSPKQRCVLAVLALEANRVVPVETITDRVWNHNPPEKARGMVQTYVARLRRVFSECGETGAALDYRSGGYLLTIDPALIDLHRFRTLLADGTEDELRRALDLWRGAPLSGLTGGWADRMRDVLTEQRVAAQRRLLDLRLDAGEHENLLGQLDELLAAHPFDEKLIGQRMLTLHRAGRQAEALAYYLSMRSRLLDEMGDEPGAELRELHQRLLRRDPALGARQAPAVHRTILVANAEDCAGPRRDGVHRILQDAFQAAGIAWTDCHRENRDDGVLVLVPPEVPKGVFVERLPEALLRGLHAHNTSHEDTARIQLRVALHVGEINDHDIAAEAAEGVEAAFRLLDAAPPRAALAESPGMIAIITSSPFFHDVVRHSLTINSASYRPVRVALRETDIVAWVHLPDHPPALRRPAAVVPRQLPPGTPYFVGRADEMRRLTALLDDRGTVVISAVNGTAGVGKTALALHWAHAMADRFPDGQLYLNLRGFDDNEDPVPPGEAVRALLAAFEIPPDRLPSTVDTQVAMLRSLLADRKVLLLLDNARDTEHVRPLLPGGHSCFVLITSRDQLSDLVAREGARPLSLTVLSDREAVELLTRRLGRQRVTREPEAVTELIEHCARLPLAVSIVAARAELRPDFPLRALAEELCDEQNRLDALTDVRSVFHWSYRQLTPAAARMFRLLGLHPGPDVSAAAAAAVAGTGLREARAMLRELTDTHLLVAQAPHRFSFHDLLRAYARELSGELDDDHERRAAAHRMLDHYLRTAHAADRLLDPHRDPIALPAPRISVTLPNLTDSSEARAWLEAEHTVLLAVIAHAADSGFPAHACCIQWSVMTFLQRGGHWSDLAKSAEIALAAARRLEDRAGQAHARRGLAHALVRHGEYEEAGQHLRLALELHRENGDLADQARTHLELDWMFGQRGRWRDALGHALEALALYETARHRVGQAGALNDIGWYRAQLGEHDEALACCRQALDLHRELGNRHGEALTWDSVGYAHHRLGQHEQAAEAYERALELHRELGNHYDRAVTLGHLGDNRQAAGDVDVARECWAQAVEILEGLRHPRATEMHVKLRAVSAANTRQSDRASARHP